MKNYRTTLTGIFAALGQVLPFFGVPAEVGHALSTIGLFLMGWFAKDHKVTGVGA